VQAITKKAPPRRGPPPGMKAGAEERTRTFMGLPPLAPEASASANSATSAMSARQEPRSIASAPTRARRSERDLFGDRLRAIARRKDSFDERGTPVAALPSRPHIKRHGRAHAERTIQREPRKLLRDVDLANVDAQVDRLQCGTIGCRSFCDQLTAARGCISQLEENTERRSLT
jgi:hypothetical protein